MNSLLLRILLSTLLFSSAQAAEAKHLILSGGPALRKWETLRIKKEQHDKWWANYILSATLKIDQLKKLNPDSKITWMVYRDGYEKRSSEDNKPYLKWIEKQANDRNVKIIWITSSESVITSINSQQNLASFDYFGHANKHAFLIDYSNDILGASSSLLHEEDLKRILPTVFSDTAICKSWGCHSGESMNQFWKEALGIELISAKGKTDYSSLKHMKMPTLDGTWIKKLPVKKQSTTPTNT